jgi:hypothetical protein
MECICEQCEPHLTSLKDISNRYISYHSVYVVYAVRHALFLRLSVVNGHYSEARPFVRLLLH